MRNYSVQMLIASWASGPVHSQCQKFHPTGGLLSPVCLARKTGWGVVACAVPAVAQVVPAVAVVLPQWVEDRPARPQHCVF